MNLFISIFLLCCSTFMSSKDVSFVLRHSAVAAIDETGKIGVHTTKNDNIVGKIKGIGNKQAYFNEVYLLQLIKSDEDAYYYLQPGGKGLVVWTYFIKSNVVTYAKLRAFPATNLPDSYLMIGKCK